MIVFFIKLRDFVASCEFFVLVERIGIGIGISHEGTKPRSQQNEFERGTKFERINPTNQSGRWRFNMIVFFIKLRDFV